MKARDIMTPSPVTVASTDSVAHAADLMRDLRIGCLPVVDAREAPVLLGIITDRDIAVRCVARQHEPTCRVRSHMTGMPVFTVQPDADVTDVLQKMEFAQVRRIPVVTKAGMLVGIISQADLATKVGPEDPATVEELLERVSAPAVVGV